MRRFGLFVLVLALAACRTPAPGPLAVAPAAPPADRSNEVLLLPTLWIQTAAEYRAAALGTFNAATRALDERLADRGTSAAVEQTGGFEALPPAVIVDIDETMLDNAPFEARLVAEGGEYSGERWAGWVKERAARAVPGAVEFARHAAAAGVVVFYVSNRDAALEEATRDNLRAAGFPLDDSLDTVLLLGEHAGQAPGEKGPRRAAVAAHHRILLLVGDDLGDFLPNTQATQPERQALVDKYASWWGTRWFVLPNPMYGSWQRALTRGAPAAERARRLRESLRTGR